MCEHDAVAAATSLIFANLQACGLGLQAATASQLRQQESAIADMHDQWGSEPVTPPASAAGHYDSVQPFPPTALQACAQLPAAQPYQTPFGQCLAPAPCMLSAPSAVHAGEPMAAQLGWALQQGAAFQPASSCSELLSAGAVDCDDHIDEHLDLDLVPELTAGCGSLLEQPELVTGAEFESVNGSAPASYYSEPM